MILLQFVISATLSSLLCAFFRFISHVRPLVLSRTVFCRFHITFPQRCTLLFQYFRPHTCEVFSSQRPRAALPTQGESSASLTIRRPWRGPSHRLAFSSVLTLAPFFSSLFFKVRASLGPALGCHFLVTPFLFFVFSLLPLFSVHF